MTTKITTMVKGKAVKTDVEFDVGDRVTFLNIPRGSTAASGEIIALQDEDKYPGKLVALRMDEPHARAHVCDGLVPSEENEEGNLEKRGWFTRPEYCTKLD